MQNVHTINIGGEVSFMTLSERLAWLNSVTGLVKGISDLKNNELALKAYYVKESGNAVTPISM